ncbi:LysR family transcriptional regulator [Blastococcus xanthinilyticus]|uniref:LysR family transcriptional regulator n=1 Tax=Blastococcus xanthinilyticus TaxID=1564164 RepID=A0A5S5D3H0_9ACTN|nr:LysR family transcriptional regulator [Blastococcus xanthinilyticus]
MELRQLAYALAVAEELHFGRAAARMRVSQQSVSEQVRRLERELGAALFVRTSRRVALTAVGEAFLPEARRAVRAAQRARDVGRRAAQGLGRELRVGYAEDLGPRLFQLTGPALAGERVHVTPVPMRTPEQLAELREQRLDLAFGWAPPPAPDLEDLLVTREPLVAAMAADHPLVGAGPFDPRALSGRPLVVVQRAVNPWLHDAILRQLHDRGATVTVTAEHSTIDQVLPLVLSSAAVGVTTASAAASRSHPGVVYRPFTAPSPTVDHRLVWRRDTGNRAVTTFVDVARRLRDSGAFLPAELPTGLPLPAAPGAR